MDVFRGSLSHYRLQLLVPALFEGSPWSGRLRLERGPVQRTFYVQDGELRGEASSVPSEHLSQLLVNLRVLEAARSVAAFQDAEREGRGLGGLLVERGWVTGPQLVEVLELKAREALFDCYEWEAGEFEFTPGAVPAGLGVAIRLPLAALHRDALTRRREWRAFWDIFRAPDTTFQVHRERADADAGAAEDELLVLAELGRPLGEMLASAREGRLFAARRVLRLYRRGALLPKAAGTLATGTGARTAHLLGLAHRRFAEGNFDEAARLAADVLEQAPVPEAHRLFREAERQAAQTIGRAVAAWGDRLRARPLGEPLPAGVTSDELYLHTRLQGGQAVLDVLRTAPMGELAAFRAIRRLMHAGALEADGEEDAVSQTLPYGVRSFA